MVFYPRRYSSKITPDESSTNVGVIITTWWIYRISLRMVSPMFAATTSSESLTAAL
jgi:hypothetical protein